MTRQSDTEHGEPTPLAAGEALCLECGLIFDLFDKDDADEWFHGHDCEV